VQIGYATRYDKQVYDWRLKMADDMDMYDTDEFIAPEPKTVEPTLTAIDRGMVTEIEIMGKRIEIVNPSYVRELQRIMLDMSNKLRAADRNINTLNSNIKKMNSQINDLRAQLAGKIDRA